MNEFGELAARPGALETPPFDPVTGRTPTHLGTAAGGLAGVGVGMGVGQALGSMGVDNPYVVAPISGAIAGAAVHTGANALEKGLTKAAFKGSLRAAGEGGVGALVAAPIDIGIANTLEKYGMNHAGSQAISGASANAIVSAPAVAAAWMMGPEVGLPATAFAAAWTAFSGGLGAFFGNKEDQEIRRRKEKQQTSEAFFQELENNNYDFEKVLRNNKNYEKILGKEYIESVRQTIDLQNKFGVALTKSEGDVDKALESDISFRKLGTKYIQHIRNEMNLRKEFIERVDFLNGNVDKTLEDPKFNSLSSEYKAFAMKQYHAEQAEKMGITFEEYEELQEIEDPNLRNVRLNFFRGLHDYEIRKNASALNLNTKNYLELLQNIRNGMSPEDAFDNAKRNQLLETRQEGYFNPEEEGTQIGLRHSVKEAIGFDKFYNIENLPKNIEALDSAFDMSTEELINYLNQIKYYGLTHDEYTEQDFKTIYENSKQDASYQYLEHMGTSKVTQESGGKVKTFNVEKAAA
jgi:hypothetical protein